MPITTPQRVLLIEDEQAIADAVIYALESEGFQVTWASTISQGLAALTPQTNLVLLDVGLPDGSGFDACRKIRLTSDLPIVFLSARNEEIDRIVGLEIGGDDYIAKPFSPRELAARVRARLRTHRPAANATTATSSDFWKPIEGTDFSHQPSRNLFRYTSQELVLTPAEHRLLAALLDHPGRILSRKELVERCLGEDSPSLERTIDAHVKTLRAKLRDIDPESDPLETRRGFGYAARKS